MATVRALSARALALAALAGTLIAAGCGGSDAPGDDMVFVSSRDGDYALYGMEADGGRQGRLTDEQGDPSTPSGLAFQVDPAWSPDGRLVAFASSREGPSRLFTMAPDGTGLRRLTATAADDAGPAWSPDGTRIVFQRGDQGRLFVVPAGGGDARRVTRDLQAESDPAWSPDGRWIAYSRRASGTEVREIWVVRPDGSGRRQVTKLGAVSVSPSWSPDGTRLAFAANRGGLFEIYAIGLDGSGVRSLARAEDDAIEPAWSPDGSRIAFSRGGAIVTVDLDGAEAVLTDEANNDSSPAWNPAAGREEGEEEG